MMNKFEIVMGMGDNNAIALQNLGETIVNQFGQGDYDFQHIALSTQIVPSKVIGQQQIVFVAVAILMHKTEKWPTGLVVADGK
jgi:hypothetical protein